MIFKSGACLNILPIHQKYLSMYEVQWWVLRWISNQRMLTQSFYGKSSLEAETQEKPERKASIQFEMGPVEDNPLFQMVSRCSVAFSDHSLSFFQLVLRGLLLVLFSQVTTQCILGEQVNLLDLRVWLSSARLQEIFKQLLEIMLCGEENSAHIDILRKTHYSPR